MFQRKSAITNDLPGEGSQDAKPWDPEFLQANAENQQSISSVEGLMRTTDFHKFMRQHGGAHRCHDIMKKMQLYRDLRDLDPTDFRKVWDNPDIQELVLVPVSFPLAAAEYLLDVVPTVLLILLFEVPIVKPLLKKVFPAYTLPNPDLAIYTAALFLIVQWRIWSWKHPSVWGWFASIYYIMEETEDCARTSQILLARIVEAVFVVFSMGLGLIVSLLFKLLLPSRASVADKLCGIGMLREVRQPMVFEEDPVDE